MAANIDLWMRFDDTYQPVLSIPVDACQRFAIHPLTWLRYVGFTIYGREGYIALVPNGPEVDYYQVTIQPGVYHYVSQESFLVDPDLMKDRTSSASSDVSTSSSRADFAQRVGARDGTCVMTGEPLPYATACHIIPHAKGHEYITNLANHRHEDLVPPLEDINDTRNGILLAAMLHISFGASEAAFLKTPNFAMTVNDVDLAMQPLAPGFITQPSNANSRLTFQHFMSNSRLTAHVAPHNSDVRLSDSNDWPPLLLFDATYGCAALKTWGVPAFVEFARQCTRHIYYDNGDNNDDGNGGPSGPGPSAKIFRQNKEREERAKRRKCRDVGQQASSTANSDTPDIADMILGLWMHNARELEPQIRAMKADRTQEKVRAWLDSAQ